MFSLGAVGVAMMVFSPSIEEQVQVEAVLLACLREGAVPGGPPLEEQPVWEVLRVLLEGVWQGEDPSSLLARLDPFDPRGCRERLVPEEAGWVLVSLFAVITATLGTERRRRGLFRLWLSRNLDSVTAMVPAYSAEGEGAGAFNRRVVREVGLACAEERALRLSPFLRRPGALGVAPRRRFCVLETVGLLELPRDLAASLDVGEVLTEVRLRVVEG